MTTSSAPVRFFIGTSGFSYAPWKGSFYPAKIKNDEMLGHYAAQLTAVEINNTFYRLPNPEVLGTWREKVHEGFRFCLKASQRITHFGRLKGVKELSDRFFSVKQALGALAGPSLFQLPPQLKVDVERLATFLADVPAGELMVFEFGSSTWHHDEVYAALRAHGATVCWVDDDKRELPMFPRGEANLYVRLRKADYSEADLEAIHRAIVLAAPREAWVFFKHEDAGTGPRFAKTLRQIARA
jgi:uncharacterized protein YecE (DUF72 family)